MDKSSFSRQSHLSVGRILVKGCCESPCEGRNPKAEVRKKAEARNPNRCSPACFSDFGFRPSFGFRGFGLRIWHRAHFCTKLWLAPVCLIMCSFFERFG